MKPERPLLTILTRIPGFHPFSKEFWFYCIKKLIGRQRGPEAVARSLAQGLTELNYSFNVNPLFESQIGDTVLVLSGIQALEKALLLKRHGKIKKLFAGPNIVVSPKDHDGILENTLIDIVVTNSKWTEDHVLLLSPILKSKTIIWPCGVVLPETKKEEQAPLVLIYKKDVSEDIDSEVISTLKKHDIAYDVLTYGTFSQNEYFEKLTKTKVLIYLQKSESQGLAMFEAWARNVPTLVYESGVFTDKSGNITHGKISAPYLAPQAGLAFSQNEFEQVWNSFAQSEKSFSPRLYIEQQFTDRITAEHLLKLIDNH